MPGTVRSLRSPLDLARAVNSAPKQRGQVFGREAARGAESRDLVRDGGLDRDEFEIEHGVQRRALGVA